jgi:hypothetical protein
MIEKLTAEDLAKLVEAFLNMGEEILNRVDYKDGFGLFVLVVPLEHPLPTPVKYGSNLSPRATAELLNGVIQKLKTRSDYTNG